MNLKNVKKCRKGSPCIAGRYSSLAWMGHLQYIQKSREKNIGGKSRVSQTSGKCFGYDNFNFKKCHPSQLLCFFESVFYLNFLFRTVIKIVVTFDLKICNLEILRPKSPLIGLKKIIIIFHSAATKRTEVMYMHISSNTAQIFHPSPKYLALQFLFQF